LHHIKPLIRKKYRLQKFPGKGGWTYVAISEIAQNKGNPFGWVKVSGSIDGYELKHCKLMPMGNGKLFLPVKAAIRKKIEKEEGDYVTVTFYVDESPLSIPDELLECFRNEPSSVYEIFISFTEGEQKAYIDWIYSAKNPETKANRIVEMMSRLQRKLKFHDLTK
jgi:hypothetical protein